MSLGTTLGPPFPQWVVETDDFQGLTSVIKPLVERLFTSPELVTVLQDGLRHGFGVAAVSAGIPLNLVQKWLGHAQLTTTAIYANAVGEEEQSIAARMW